MIAKAHTFRNKGLVERCGDLLPQDLRRRLARSWLKARYHELLGRDSSGLTCSLPGGETFRILPAYRHISWNLEEYSAFRAAIRAGDTVLDIGANAGNYSLLFGRWVGASGKVYAFEPASAAYAGLCAHLGLNGLLGAVEPARLAASDSSGNALLSAPPHFGTNRLIGANETAAGPVERVETVTVDEFCAWKGIRPRFLKIDVEGFELAVLRGARETIAAAGGDLALFVEMHPSIWPELGISQDDIAAEIEAQGLRAVPLAPGQDLWTAEGVCARVAPR
jgi:FkbM family methyltransferase